MTPLSERTKERPATAAPGIADIKLATAATRQRMSVSLDVLDRTVRQVVSGSFSPPHQIRSPAPRGRAAGTASMVFVAVREVFALMRAKRTGEGGSMLRIVIRLLMLVVARTRRPTHQVRSI
jgi:hypothetical protein